MYTPRRTIHRNMEIVRNRVLPISGTVHVSVGDIVDQEQCVLSTEIKGDLFILRLDQKLGLEAEYILPHLKVKLGDHLQAGDIIFQKKGFWGFGEDLVQSPLAGCVEFIEKSNAHIGIRMPAKVLDVKAFIAGEIIRTASSREVSIESKCALLQGLFGVGGEVYGRALYVPTTKFSPIEIESLKVLTLENSIILGGSGITKEAYTYANEQGVLGIVTASASCAFIEEVFGGVSGVSDPERSIGPVFVIVEGFGTLPLSSVAVDFFEYANGMDASLSGFTQVRAGAIRPELILKNADETMVCQRETQNKPPEVNDQVRIVKGEYQGRLGRLCGLPELNTKLSSGIITLAAEVEVDGVKVMLARANLEAI